jgi:iron complex outermembrane receptor protein
VLRPDRRTSIKLLYGEAFRAPSISEVENGGEPKTGPEVEPEEIRTLELVVQRQLSRGLMLSFGGYQYRMTGLIDQVPNPDDSVYVFRNTARAEAVGVYTGLEWQGRDGTQFDFSASVVNATDEDDRRLTNSPELLVKAGVAVALPRAFQVGITSRYESARRTTAGTETDDAILADLFLAWRPRARPGVEAGIRINNVLDADWATPGGVQHLMPAIAQDGRNVLVSLGFRF